MGDLSHLHRPPPPSSRGPAPLSSQASRAAAQHLVHSVAHLHSSKAESSDDIPCWKGPRLLAFKRHLLSHLGEGGPVLQAFYDSIFAVRRSLKEYSAVSLGARASASGGVDTVVALSREAEGLTQDRLFALWWMFVPEEEEEDDVVGALPPSIRLDIPGINVGADFFLQLVTFLSGGRRSRLHSLVLSYNFILRRDTDRAVRNLTNLRHVTLTGSLNADIFDILAKHSNLHTFTTRAPSIMKAKGETFLTFLASQAETLVELRMEDHARFFDDLGMKNFLPFVNTLTTCKKLKVLGVNATFLKHEDRGRPPPEDMPTVSELHIEHADCFPIHDNALTFKWAVVREFFPKCESLSICGACKYSPAALSGCLDEVAPLLFRVEVPVLASDLSKFFPAFRQVRSAELKLVSFDSSSVPVVQSLVFHRLTDFKLSGQKLWYADFATVFFGAAETIVSFQVELLRGMADFDEKDFIDRLRRRGKNDFRRLKHFTLGAKRFCRPVASEEAVLALLEAAGGSLAELDLTWCRYSTGSALGRVEEAGRRVGLLPKRNIPRRGSQDAQQINAVVPQNALEMLVALEDAAAFAVDVLQ